jgi:sugar phosphate permease
MQLPAGLLSDSWGPRNTISLFFGIAFAGSLILGLAPTAFWAILGRGLVGLGVAMLFVPTMKVLAEWFRVREFAMMTGILMAMGGLGSLTAATPLAILSAKIGWRVSFIVVAVFTLLLVMLVWIFVRDKPADMGWPSPRETAEFDSPRETAEFEPLPIGLAEGVRKVLTNSAFWPVAGWSFFTFAVFFSFGGLWGGPYLMHIFGYGKGPAGQILSMLAVGMIVGSPLLSYVSNNIVKARKPILVLASIVMLFITAILVFYTDRISMVGLYLLCFGMGIFGGAVVVIGFTTTKELFPVQIAGTATGLINLFPFAGGAIFPPILGHLLERQGRFNDAFTVTGYRQAFAVLFACAMIALVSSFFLKETMVKK